MVTLVVQTGKTIGEITIEIQKETDAIATGPNTTATTGITARGAMMRNLGTRIVDGVGRRAEVEERLRSADSQSRQLAMALLYLLQRHSKKGKRESKSLATFFFVSTYVPS